MEKHRLEFPAIDRLKTIVTKAGSGARAHELGTAFLPAGSRMPEQGESTHPRHEVSVILEGKLETTSGGETVILGAGDIVSIPGGDSQSSRVLEDTRLIYVFFDD